WLRRIFRRGSQKKMTNLTPLRVSYSSLNTAAYCLRKFEFNKLYPRKPRTEDQFAADVGKALHAGVQDYFIHQDPDSALWQLMLNYPYLWEYNQVRDDRSLEAAVSTLEEILAHPELDEWELISIRKDDGTL